MNAKEDEIKKVSGKKKKLIIKIIMSLIFAGVLALAKCLIASEDDTILVGSSPCNHVIDFFSLDC